MIFRYSVGAAPLQKTTQLKQLIWHAKTQASPHREQDTARQMSCKIVTQISVSDGYMWRLWWIIFYFGYFLSSWFLPVSLRWSLFQLPRRHLTPHKRSDVHKETSFVNFIHNNLMSWKFFYFLHENHLKFTNFYTFLGVIHIQWCILPFPGAMTSPLFHYLKKLKVVFFCHLYLFWQSISTLENINPFNMYQHINTGILFGIITVINNAYCQMYTLWFI